MTQPRQPSDRSVRFRLAAPFAAACAMAAAFTPLADGDALEPSIRNEAEHSLALACAATNRAGARAASAALPIDTNGLSRNEIAIRLVSMQKADGRWAIGTNDTTTAAIAILEAVLEDGGRDDH